MWYMVPKNTMKGKPANSTITILEKRFWVPNLVSNSMPFSTVTSARPDRDC